MGHTVRIESTRHLPAADVLVALSAGGVEGIVLETSPCVRLRVLAEDATQLARRVALALEGLISERRLALVPDRVGESAFVLRPPAG
jgi:hypothetical protein